MSTVIRTPMSWRRLAIASLAVVTMMAFGIPSAYATTPVAVDDSTSTNEDIAVTISVLENDDDPDTAVGDITQLTIESFTQPTHGAVTQLGTDLIYTPDPDTNYDLNGGDDTFTYTISNASTAISESATVTVTVNPVNDAPVAEDDAFTTDEDTQLTGNVTADNGSGADSDVESALTDATVVDDVDRGTLSLNADGSFTYTPNTDYNGADGFTYTVGDGTATSNVATVTITVNPVDDPSPSTPAQAFDDLEGLSSEAVAAIETLVDLEITTGTSDTSFSPEMITERWQMALFLTRVLTATDTTLPTGEAGFSDLSGYSTEAQTAMNQLANLGISVGTSPDEFSPAGNVTRWQMALFLVRTLEAGGVTLPSADQSGFTDLAEYPDEVQDAVDVLVTLGITTGTTESTFSPEVELPRWQMALFLARVIEVIQG